ncbi:lipoprotein transporter subunit LolE [Enterovibrio norvegicus]|uniref:lipoprotein-releasing ABC transporter permease subunit LolE n=1 Tax=Enterovibrio norvegicus TaxID=188144 RepID=UPI0003123977|nr:lipoprotein-releasing ABC transporter permease subunit LolE [Enterovibrio norvegicus]MCC4798888.1 lipoprotein-releasing ABC transporter permease subunit LolE [Enterovibrio norvegicus]OEF59774.1 lipoprotein transporter subunit LolE [Enterovibrio norvegicus]PMH72703.1 lipoprotein transporter subunit LolE [Enterovibrio norvegicus]PMI37507.1 lipoprotein transporter subunit LolE [Enterovibrio norvegicus]PMN50694.1 lipoprotein transporter subunit LolE [Enterovibrio norvegicus]
MMEPLALFIGRRFSKAKRRNKLVSFISVSSMIGISVGVMVIIVGLSAMNGFERELEKRVLAVIPHAQLEGVDAPVASWRTMQETAIANPNVEAGAPYVTFTALLEKGANLKPVQIRGIDPKAEETVSNIHQYVLDNGWQRLQPGEQAIVLGKGIADALGVKVGDWVTALIPSPDPDLKLRAPKRIRLQVLGILSLGGQVDHGLSLIPIQDAQSYIGMGDAVTGVALKLSEPLEARHIVREVGKTLKEYVYLKNWTQEYGFLYRDIQMVRTIMYLVMVLVIGVACFNIVSTLMMAVKDRAADVAVLRTMGAKDGLIRSIFIWHGLLSGLFGSLIGSVMGCLIAFNLTSIVGWIESLTGQDFLSGDIYFVDFLPTEPHLMDVFLVSTTAVVLSLLATWYPAQRACKLHPASVLSAR